MRILIDCFKLVKGHGSSIGIYNHARNLVYHLAQYRDASGDDTIASSEIVVIGNRENRADFSIDGVRFVEIKNGDPRNNLTCVLWELFAVSEAAKREQADRIIFPRGYTAVDHPVPDIAIIHDLIPLYYERHHRGAMNRFKRAYINYRLKQSAKTCRHIITDSEASRQDLKRYYHIDDKKISVIHCGVNRTGTKNSVANSNKNGYICALTSGFPHKNAKGIFRSYEAYCRISKDPLPMTVLGTDSVQGLELPEDVHARITCMKYIPDDNLFYSIIANSRMFLFLSLIEGFGLPPLEAMQLGVPVICSNTYSLPEVVGDAAELVDPQDPEAVAQVMVRLAGDERRRKELVKRGKERIKRFAWNEIAGRYWRTIVAV